MCNKNFFFVVLRTFTGPVEGQKNNNISSFWTPRPRKSLLLASCVYLEHLA